MAFAFGTVFEQKLSSMLMLYLRAQSQGCFCTAARIRAHEDLGNAQVCRNLHAVKCVVTHDGYCLLLKCRERDEQEMHIVKTLMTRVRFCGWSRRVL